MKAESFLAVAWLASTAMAIGPAVPGKPPRPKGKPAKMEGWKWRNPFTNKHLERFEIPCQVEKSFKANEYLLDDLSDPEPKGLLPYRDALKKVFAGREYPGSWEGVDPHGYDRNLLAISYEQVPLKVREWIEEQERTQSEHKGLFAVYRKAAEGTKIKDVAPVPEKPVDEDEREGDEHKLVIFAPGALSEILPLWVAEASECTETLLDLSKYGPDLVDGGVVAYPISWHWAKRGEGRRDMEFVIKAHVLKLKPGETAPPPEPAPEKKVEKKGEKVEEKAKEKKEKVEEKVEEKKEEPKKTEEVPKAEGKPEKDEL